MINENGDILPYSENIVANSALKILKALKNKKIKILKQEVVKRINECMF